MIAPLHSPSIAEVKSAAAVPSDAVRGMPTPPPPYYHGVMSRIIVTSIAEIKSMTALTLHTSEARVASYHLLCMEVQ